jgi:hypothetical protein
MSQSDIWSGTVDAKLESGKKTGFKVKKGDVITIIASGWVERGSGRAYGPQGDESLVGSYKPAGLVYPDGLVGALLMKIGDDYLTPINTGVFRWTVPTDGELTFLINDLAGDYGNNSGSFNVSVEKKTLTTEPTADVIKYGDKVRFLNGYANWNGGYLSVYDSSKEVGAKYDVVSVLSPEKEGPIDTWLVGSATGKPDGDRVRSGDTIRLLNLYGDGPGYSDKNGGGYLDTNNHATSPELYNVSTAEKANRGVEKTGHKTLDWVVMYGAVGSQIYIGDPISLRNEYNNSQGGYLDTCNHFAGRKTIGYHVYTNRSPNRAGVGTGSWKVLRAITSGPTAR